MKLQVKLALYNTLTKLAIVLFTGAIILFSLEQISYNNISRRLRSKRDELVQHLSSDEMMKIINKQGGFIDYNILKEEYIIVKPLAYVPDLEPVESIKTANRTIRKTTDTYLILTYKFNIEQHTYLLELGETIDAVEELKQTIRGFALVMLVLALSLTLVFDLIFTKHLMNPLYQIIDRKLIKVNDPLNFDYEKVTTSTNDFTLLDESISLLMKKISDLFLLEKQFIANVSHELLTPISIISSRLENILLQETLSEEGENKLYASLRTLSRLKSIINGLLLISKVENNQFDKNDTVKLTEILGEVEEELDDRLQDKNISLYNHIKRQYAIKGNRSLMHILLFNIINNAIKYNNPEGSITISDEMQGGNYVMSIADTGHGMDSALIEKAFNRFEKSESDDKESYGLGLAIVKSIATFHNIGIEIDSKAGSGTRFKLIFN